MDHERFRDWASRVDELTAAQRKEVAAVPSDPPDPPEGAASLAAIELGVDEERRCPHCGAGGAVCRGARRAVAGERVRGAVPIQTVNSRHSQIKGFLRGFRGIATKYLDSYLRWFHLVELGEQPSPRACLEAAITKPCLRLAN